MHHAAPASVEAYDLGLQRRKTLRPNLSPQGFNIFQRPQGLHTQAGDKVRPPDPAHPALRPIDGNLIAESAPEQTVHGDACLSRTHVQAGVLQRADGLRYQAGLSKAGFSEQIRHHSPPVAGIRADDALTHHADQRRQDTRKRPPVAELGPARTSVVGHNPQQVIAVHPAIDGKGVHTLNAHSVNPD
nr:hypothetical protein [Brevundimonas sp.]